MLPELKDLERLQKMLRRIIKAQRRAKTIEALDGLIDDAEHLLIDQGAAHNR